ncbi:iron complex transport system substrate-binding protein [Desulfosarcina sp. BuS5]|uniref:ABC transporter substrate-binding protein n=1 Tax=Desulfosarcina sp. BuS5 TaxID=933262 RepID=UPI000AE09EEE|nr:ABC transporter substrate-binding protein [Desulfosarcina sp. BuS5]WDN87304.1 iron complex transport system substrate-binding protein [Desulfosarcina sp. BuS5]
MSTVFHILLLLSGIWLNTYGIVYASSFCIKNDTLIIDQPIIDPSIIDQSGRKIVVNKPFKRIISLYGAHTENLFALGLDEEIIGVARNEVYPEKALLKPVFSYHDGPEKFLAATPDLVLVRPMIDRGYPQLMQRLEQNGITVCSIQPATIEEMFLYWKILGILTGKKEKASEVTAHFKQSVSLFEVITKQIKNKKRVYFEAIHKRMKTFSSNSMAVFALEKAGGINIAKDAKQVRNTNIAAYGKEKILSHASEIDVFLAQYGTMNRPSLSLIKNEPGFSLIKAVQNGEIYIIDEMIVCRPTSRLLNGIYEIGRILYPDYFNKNVEAAIITGGLLLKEL